MSNVYRFPERWINGNLCANCGDTGTTYHKHTTTGQVLYDCGDDDCNYRVPLHLLGIKERDVPANSGSGHGRSLGDRSLENSGRSVKAGQQQQLLKRPF